MNDNTQTPPTLTRDTLAKGLGKTAFAFRGYNATNLGRTPELLRHPKYGQIVEKYLQRASDICTDVMKFPVDLAQRVRLEKEATVRIGKLFRDIGCNNDAATLKLNKSFMQGKFEWLEDEIAPN